MLPIRLTHWFVAIAMIASVFVGCEAIQSINTPPPEEPGSALVNAATSADAEDVVGAVSILAPSILGPYGLVLAAVARAWYTKRAAKSAIKSVQLVVDALTPKERAALAESQSPGARRLTRETRGKRFSPII